MSKVAYKVVPFVFSDLKMFDCKEHLGLLACFAVYSEPTNTTAATFFEYLVVILKYLVAKYSTKSGSVMEAYLKVIKFFFSDAATLSY